MTRTPRDDTSDPDPSIAPTDDADAASTGPSSASSGADTTPATGVSSTGRRTFLAGTAALGAASLSGCVDVFGGNDDGGSEPFNWIGSGPGQSLGQDGTPMAEMPALEGELTIYSGRHEFLVDALVDSIESLYDDFTANVRYGEGSQAMVNQIITEGSGTNADVFYSVNAGALVSLSEAGRTTALSSDLRDIVSPEFSTEDWIGTSGRVRTVPYNTNTYSESDIPDDIMAIPTELDADFGWSPVYGSCQAFVTAMRILEGEEATRQWLQELLDAGVDSYPNEQAVNQAIADGEIDVGFTNHYYIQRVLAGNPDAPIATAFTEGDAGATFNVAGAAVTDQAGDVDLAENFIRHLLSAEAQSYFAVETKEYPLAPNVDPVGDLPRVDALDVPDIDLAELGDLEATIDLMEDVGVDV
ncbi:extracellular solute-binding protein [Salinarchaeum laminariae]|uniref:extracellular solute-binding protein n=1 Tax=Salinarchaeum laminariae TaxID=869888 RepID=UPI0020BDF78A|nr:extracellular solute-binding protein [Salinarchaeum laminariae]